MNDKEIFKLYKKAFGDNLQRIRKERTDTVRKVDTNTKFDASNYHKYETGKGNPTIETLFSIARGLGVEPKVLLDFKFDIDEEI